eukprot:Nk52_evm21s262 gene=Nk52_evmTU21s262
MVVVKEEKVAACVGKTGSVVDHEVEVVVVSDGEEEEELRQIERRALEKKEGERERQDVAKKRKVLGTEAGVPEGEEGEEDEKKRYKALLSLSSFASPQIREQIQLIAASKLAKKDIVLPAVKKKDEKKLKSSNSKLINKAYFGSSLDDIMKFTDCECVAVDGRLLEAVPDLVTKAMDFLEDHLDKEGIFRISGSAARISKLKKAFNNCANEVHSSSTQSPRVPQLRANTPSSSRLDESSVSAAGATSSSQGGPSNSRKKKGSSGSTSVFDFSGIEFPYENSGHVHDVCGLLKCFLRELAEPLLTYKLYQPFMKLYDIFYRHSKNEEGATNEDDQNIKSMFRSGEVEASAIQYIQWLTILLPANHRHLLLALTRFLNRVVEHKATNKMDAGNLAKVFGVNILRAKNDQDILACIGQWVPPSSSTHSLSSLQDLTSTSNRTGSSRDAVASRSVSDMPVPNTSSGSNAPGQTGQATLSASFPRQGNKHSGSSGSGSNDKNIILSKEILLEEQRRIAFVAEVLITYHYAIGKVPDDTTMAILDLSVGQTASPSPPPLNVEFMNNVNDTLNNPQVGNEMSKSGALGRSNSKSKGRRGSFGGKLIRKGSKSRATIASGKNGARNDMPKVHTRPLTPVFGANQGSLSKSPTDRPSSSAGMAPDGAEQLAVFKGQGQYGFRTPRRRALSRPGTPTNVPVQSPPGASSSKPNSDRIGPGGDLFHGCDDGLGFGVPNARPEGGEKNTKAKKKRRSSFSDKMSQGLQYIKSVTGGRGRSSSASRGCSPVTSPKEGQSSSQRRTEYVSKSKEMPSLKGHHDECNLNADDIRKKLATFQTFNAGVDDSVPGEQSRPYLKMEPKYPRATDRSAPAKESGNARKPMVVKPMVVRPSHAPIIKAQQTKQPMKIGHSSAPSSQEAIKLEGPAKSSSAIPKGGPALDTIRSSTPVDMGRDGSPKVPKELKGITMSRKEDTIVVSDDEDAASANAENDANASPQKQGLVRRISLRLRNKEKSGKENCQAKDTAIQNDYRKPVPPTSTASTSTADQVSGAPPRRASSWRRLSLSRKQAAQQQQIGSSASSSDV